jgi:cytochrome c
MKKLGLLFVALLMVSLSSCGDGADKAKDAAKNATETTTNAVKEGAEKAADAVKETAEKATDAVKEGAEKAVDAVKEGAEKVADAAKDVDGKALFASNGCSACHNMTAKTVGPAVVTIGKGYEGKKDELVKFLKGEGKAIVDPANFAMMQPQLNTTKKMNDAERAAIADYFLTAK